MQKLKLQAVGQTIGWRMSGFDMELRQMGQDSSLSGLLSMLSLFILASLVELVAGQPTLLLIVAAIA